MDHMEVRKVALDHAMRLGPVDPGTAVEWAVALETDSSGSVITDDTGSPVVA